MAIIHLNRHNDIKDGSYRPLATCPTVAAAGAWLREHDAELSLYVEAHWRIEPSAPVDLKRQQAAKIRRVKAIARAAGRVVSRIDQRRGFPHHYRALLAR